MSFKHILVPYDGSGPSADALDKALWLAGIDESTKLTVAHVINLQPIIVGEMSFTPSAEYQEQIQEQANAILAIAKEKIGQVAGSSTVILVGSPAAAIVEFAESEGCDLIVMGSRGLGSFKEFVLGSVSHNVVQHAKAPVLIVK